MTTYREAQGEVIEFFDREHQKGTAQELEEQIEQAKAGDLWLLGQLHLRSLDNPIVKQRLERELSLLKALHLKVSA